MKEITDYLTTPDLLCQLAEEAAELAQAALKLKRAMEGTNPTPKSVETCTINLLEEIADVDLCEILLNLDSDENLIIMADIAEKKERRWLKRLEAAHGK